MFYYISGKVAAAEAGLVVIDAGGVGYAINTSYPSARTVKVGEQALFYTFLRVAENIFELYGFVRRDELDCFKQLVTISGVGPRVALAILGTVTPEKLARAEHEYKVDRIHRLFGLDKKLVDKYMRMGYASHQVKRAMFLARHCDKSVEELLAMKTRQQKWGDICEQLGLPRDACMK